MMLPFTKMHACGNDYIFIFCEDEGVSFDPAKAARELSKRRFSIGADGLVLILPSNTANAKMRIFNADGSEGKMCGTALCCVGKLLFDKGKTGLEIASVETASGVRRVILSPKERKVTAEMGRGDFDPRNVPVITERKTVFSAPVRVGDTEAKMTCLSMGNPHAVLFLEGESLDKIDLKEIGVTLGESGRFPKGVNAEIVKCVGENRLQMRVYERGSGETLACGTGACAASLTAVRMGLCSPDSPITVQMKGGVFVVTVEKNDEIFLTQEVNTVYEGVLTWDGC